MLTEEEKRLICRVATDNETGRHLLTRRPDDYIAMREELDKALKTPPTERTDRQVEMYEYMRSLYPEDTFERYGYDTAWKENNS